MQAVPAPGTPAEAAAASAAAAAAPSSATSHAPDAPDASVGGALPPVIASAEDVTAAAERPKRVRPIVLMVPGNGTGAEAAVVPGEGCLIYNI